jgi:quinol monooxygenase YgiN
VPGPTDLVQPLTRAGGDRRRGRVPPLGRVVRKDSLPPKAVALCRAVAVVVHHRGRTGHARLVRAMPVATCRAVFWSPGVASSFHRMIFITAKFRVLPEHADDWPRISAEFTRATRAEPGCLWFDWSRSLDDPDEYVLVEAFRDGDAGAAHVRSDHFRTAQQTLPRHLAETPRIVNFTVPQDDWSELGEMAVPPPRS